MNTRTLYRPVNKIELKLIEESEWRSFPPRLRDQPIFYPVTNQAYASQITVEWNLPSYNNGFVTAFDVEEEYLKKFRVEKVGLSYHTELWVPAEQLTEFNQKIVGEIRVLEAYSSEPNSQFVKIVDTFLLTDFGHVVLVEPISESINIPLQITNLMDSKPIGQLLHSELHAEKGKILYSFKIDEKTKNELKPNTIRLLKTENGQ